VVTRLADLFPILLLTAVGSLLLSPLAMRLANVLGLVDVPGSAPHKRHSTPIPSMGGLVMGSAILITYLLLRPAIAPEVTGILLGAAIVLVWGVLDDRFDLSPVQKLVGQLLAAGLLVRFGVEVHIARTPWLDLCITLIWMVGLTNAFNLVDSMDGLAIGLGGIAAAFFMLVTIDASQPVLAMLSAAVLGAAAGTFYFNVFPARMFLGDSGSQLLGFILAAIGIAYVPGQAGLPQGVSWFTPILVLGVPIFDTSLVVISRLRRREPIFHAHQDHTYHRLVALGLDTTRSVIAMQLVAVMLGLIAFIALDASVVAANILFGVILLGAVILLIFFESTAHRKMVDHSPEAKG
jgi:UDP-GlcNAc:undecaprenyl-phosphate GlcNAc-1-phosphate transferase